MDKQGKDVSKTARDLPKVIQPVRVKTLVSEPQSSTLSISYFQMIEERALNRKTVADQGKKTWSDREEDTMVLGFGDPTGNSVGVYTLLGSSLYLDLVSCVVSCTSIFGVRFDPF